MSTKNSRELDDSKKICTVIMALHLETGESRSIKKDHYIFPFLISKLNLKMYETLYEALLMFSFTFTK